MDQKMDMIVDKMIAELEKQEDGFQTTTGRLLIGMGYDFDHDELMDLHFKLFDKAEEKGLYLDMSEHDGKIEGLPYNLDFIVKIIK